MAAPILLCGVSPSSLSSEFSATGLQQNDGENNSFDGSNGWRDDLEQKGVDLEADLTLELAINTRGGLRKGSGLLGNLNLVTSIDSGKLGLWHGGTFSLYFLGNFGDDPTSFIGDTQATSNIEAFDTFKLYEAWYEQSWQSGRFSLLLGLHDYNSEFDALEYAGLFFNSSFGISPDISQTGPSIFPTTALGLRFRYEQRKMYLLGAIYDGVPGEPDDPRGTKIVLKKSDGLFYGAEVGATPLEDGLSYYKLAIGCWFLDSNFEDFAGIKRATNFGIYGIGELSVFTEVDPSQGLGVFFQAGYARADRNQISKYVGVGLNYAGLLPGRNSDVFGFGIAHARNGEPFLNANSGLEKGETAVECTYSVDSGSSVTFQADAQIVIDPSMDASVRNALQLALRVGLAF
jgi:porin